MKKLKILILLSIVICTTACSNKSSIREHAKMDYTLPAEDYKTRMKASNPKDWHRVKFKAVAPTGGVTLSDHGVFKAYMERNIDYLLNSFSVNHMMYPFWVRAGKTPKSDLSSQTGWDKDFRGSNTGRFLMGAGNTLRWIENAELRSRLNEVIDIIEDCREPNGYILPYPPIIDSLRYEEPNYARAWLTHGLIDAAIAGNPKAYGLLRGHADWFNTWDIMHPKLIYWGHNSHQGHIASTRTYLSPTGKPEDLQTAEKYYVCDWWIDELAARHEEAIWQYPLQNPHCYLITSFEAYLDHYIATGDESYLNAMLCAWEMIHDSWEHVGGSMAICETKWDIINGKRVLKHCWDKSHECSHLPHSYYLGAEGHTGETCGSVFWVKFNQRLHQLYPDEEKYMTEIEKSIYNVLIANQQNDGLIRYHATMQGRKDKPGEASNTCCEGQGTRLLGSLPEYIYSIADDGIYVNLYEASSINCKINGQPAGLTLDSQFPYKPEVAIKVSISSPLKMKLRIRIPSWASEDVAISVNGKQFAAGKAGTYVELSRKWENDDKIEFTLPMSLKFTKYEGTEPLVLTERVAVEYGPILLACVSKGNVSDLDGLINLKDRLLPDAANPLYFSVKGDSSRYFMPYWLISTEPFSVYTSVVQAPEIILSEYIISPNGFTVEFYNNLNWEGKPAYRGTTKNLYFESGNKGDKPVVPGVNLTNYSSRFEAEFVSPVTDDIIFSINADDNYWLYIDGKCVSKNERWTNGFVTCKINVTKSQKYKLKLEHKQKTGASIIALKANVISRSL